ncbi:oxygen-independent coproporphyrinogen-III oxidase-like protein YqeR [Verrucomicrobiota bacterium]|nr:oxygen-independent coproporphyrinogen-III oxidase-like protein YqeR [Verrucomicrobiota bacterium]
MTPSVQPATALYLHVPFCASSCDFCSFYQEQPKRGEIDRYLAAIERELELHPPGRVETAFWGGGTPGLLPADDLRRLGQAMTRAAGQPSEWSVELAPSSVRADKLAALKEMGVTRVSMGVQSFDDLTLDALGRRHSPKQIMEAWELIEAAGFASRNLDLIFAIPGQDEQRWTEDLRRAIELQPDHLSTYCLTFEEDTAMFVKLSQGKVKIDRELEARLYRQTWEQLEANGYAQYETSNFARPGHACRHNLITWEMGSWIGYGPSAASQWGQRRWTNPSNLDQWIKGIEAGTPVLEQVKDLSATDLLCDALVFGLRLNAGVNPAALAARFATPLPARVTHLFEALIEEGLMEAAGSQVRLTAEGRMRADAVGVSILERFD